ncbi:MAG: DUF885 family protein [Lachnospiraceae bacterium]|nr:DUF885 family protein [Lachnospiraceae bacterium]
MNSLWKRLAALSLAVLVAAGSFLTAAPLQADATASPFGRGSKAAQAQESAEAAENESVEAIKPETEEPTTVAESETEGPEAETAALETESPVAETEEPTTAAEPETAAPETESPETEPQETDVDLASAQEAFDALTQELFLQIMSDNALDLHYTLRYPENYGITDAPATFGTYSLEFMEEDKLDTEEKLAQLKAIDRELLTKDSQVVYDILLDTMESSLAVSEFPLYDEQLSPTTGIQTNLPILMAEYTFNNKKDVDTYLALLRDLPAFYDQIIAFEQKKSEAGLFMSDVAVDDLVESCTAFLQDQENHYLITTFDTRVDALSDLTQEEKASYKEQNKAAFQEAVIPAYENLIAGLTALKGTGKNEIGLAGLPEGKAYYEALVAQTTGTRYSVEELIEQVEATMSKDMMALSFQALLHPRAVEKLESFSFSYTDPEEILTVLQEKIKSEFPELPPTAYTIKHVPEALQGEMSPAFYLTPCVDDYSMNSIYINDGSLDASSLFSTLAHEGFPGHLVQTVYALANLKNPVMAVISCPGYSEGWATYVEMQSFLWDEGTDKNVLKIMQLNQQATLALYALADLYIHYEGYSREQIGEFLMTNFGIDDVEVQNEFYNYIMESPTNYLWYYVGYLEFRQMREEAEDTLGRKFDALAFNTFLLDKGDCSFRVLRRYFDEWLAEQK